MCTLLGSHLLHGASHNRGLLGSGRCWMMVLLKLAGPVTSLKSIVVFPCVIRGRFPTRFCSDNH